MIALKFEDTSLIDIYCFTLNLIKLLTKSKEGSILDCGIRYFFKIFF